MLWAVEGAVLWQRYGLSPPAVVRQATQRYFAAENKMQDWLDERCHKDKEATALTRELYLDYSAWLKAGNEFVPTEKRFVETLEMLLGAELQGWRQPKTGRRGFRGVALKRAEMIL
jgi:putative DNA primase/helicase